MLIEENFQVVSVDASDKMLKYALKERWNRRKDPGFDDWSKPQAKYTHTHIYMFILNTKSMCDAKEFSFFLAL